MKRLTSIMAALALASIAAASCGGSGEQNSAHEGAAAAAVAPPPAHDGRGLDITFTTEPDPPTSGENAFAVTVTGGSGPVSDADVSVQFHMPAMPEMKMAEIRNTIPLRHDEGGRYRGKGSILMAGKWDVTVMVMRDGQQIGSRTVSVAAGGE